MPSYAITGASRGIGFEFVKQLSSVFDNKVFAIVRNKKTATQLEELKTKRPNVYILQADIKDHKALNAAASEASRITGGTLDVLINNAAAIQIERHHLPFDAYSDADVLTADILEAVHNNVIGVIHTINAFLPLVRAGGTKKIITISSGVADPAFVATTGDAGSGPYTISKTGLNMVVLKYGVEYKDEGIIFLALSPGLVATAIDARHTGDQIEAYNAMIAGFRKVKPDFSGPLTTEESVKMQLEVIHKVTIKDTGAFLSHHGNSDWL